MKNIKILVLLSIVFSMSSCTDLTEEPVSLLSPNGFIQTAEDAETIINGAYGLMTSEPYWGRKLSTSIMLRSDMVDIGNTGTADRRIQINDFSMDASNGMISSFWPRSYEIISAANTAIAGVNDADRIPDERKKEVIAEARWVRAFAYFMLVRCFGNVPYVDKAGDPAAVIDMPRMPEDEVYDKIIADLDYAKENLPMVHEGVKSRPSKGAAYTMLADVYLTRGNFAEAYTNAKWVIDNKAALNYGLESNFQDLFDATKNNGSVEHIFSLDYLADNRGYDGGDDFLGPMTGIRSADNVIGNGAGWGVMVPSMEVYNSFDVDDYRTQVSFDTAAFVNGVLTRYADWDKEPRPHIAKFSRITGASDPTGRRSANSYPMYRFAEVLLIAAEAGVEIGESNEELLGFINELRKRARDADGTPRAVPADLTGTLTVEQVIEERRIELAFEGKRWWDIKRRKLGASVFGAGGLEPQNFSDKDYLFPIPQYALDISPSLLPQNPGY